MLPPIIAFRRFGTTHGPRRSEPPSSATTVPVLRASAVGASGALEATVIPTDPTAGSQQGRARDPPGSRLGGLPTANGCAQQARPVITGRQPYNEAALL